MSILIQNNDTGGLCQSLDNEPNPGSIRKAPTSKTQSFRTLGLRHFILITSRTWRIASLSVGIQVPLRKAERADLWEPKRPRHLGGIIPEWWAPSSRNGRARSNRNGGRDHSGMLGDIERNQRARSAQSYNSPRADGNRSAELGDDAQSFMEMGQGLHSVIVALIPQGASSSFLAHNRRGSRTNGSTEITEIRAASL